MRVDVQATQDQQDERAAREDALIQQLASMTPAQAAQWVDNNVVDLASAKQVLKIYAKILCIIARRL